MGSSAVHFQGLTARELPAVGSFGNPGSDATQHPGEDPTMEGIDTVPVRQARQTQRVEHRALVDEGAVVLFFDLELVPEPRMIEALNSITGMPVERSASPVSWRLSRWLDSPSVGSPRPPR